MKKLLLLSVSILFSIILLEILLQLFTPFPINTQSNKKPHRELGYVLDPAYPDIAESGFRNKGDPGNQEIYAIGDSHTYGINATWDQAWPYKLKDIVGKKDPTADVYNLGISSYNIYQYYRLFEIATEYSPKYIIIGLFPANDLLLGSCGILNLEYWQGRMDELGIRNESCGTSNRSGSNRNGTSKRDLHLGSVESIVRFAQANVAIVNAAELLIWERLKTYISYKRETIDVPASGTDTGDGSLYRSEKDVEFQVDGPLMARHARHTDLQNPMVKEGFLNSRILFARMKDISDKGNIQLIVLMIPSKQRVMARWAKKNSVAVSDLFDRAYVNENDVFEKFQNIFSDLSIPAGDVTDRMVDLITRDLADGKQTYPYEDPHPLQHGYIEYAKVVAELMSLEGPGN